MSPSSRRGLLVFALGAVLIIAALAADYIWFSGGDDGGFASFRIGGPFTLVDQNGKTRHDSDFRGGLMMVYFGYTYCPDACPTALQAMSRALDDLGDAGTAVQPIFITVDPERDTVQQMKVYAGNFHPRLIALTGTVEQTTAAARAYRIYFEKVKGSGSGSNDYTVDHSSFIFIMGRDGRYLTHLPSDASPDRIAATLKKYL